VAGEDLERDGLVERDVVRAVDRPHAAAAQQGLDPAAAQGHPDQGVLRLVAHLRSAILDGLRETVPSPCNRHNTTWM
jgi:hypothetical protein